ncbi:hypothetical protein [Hymenobacter sp.]|jgi:hypothetical protein|uniref:hypothetical protein n=1 Tax=Hymenobacter sp. TaxID=1898978 RepID=UPI002ED7E70E
MTARVLEILLTDRCKSLDLKRKAFETLGTILSDTSSNDEIDLGGFDRTEIKTMFDRFEYQVDKRHSGSVIRTKVGLYVEDTKNVWLDSLEPIGYYELETDFNGEILDDYFVIEKQKYVDDIAIVSHFQNMNKILPLGYLRRNHIQYELVAYISLVGTLFISKQFEGTGRFIKRAYTYLETTDNSRLDQNYLKESKSFLKMMKSYLVRNNLVTEGLKEELQQE